MADSFENDPAARSTEPNMLRDLTAWLATQEHDDKAFAVAGFRDGEHLMNDKTDHLAYAVGLFYDATPDEFDRVLLRQSSTILAEKTWPNGVERLEWQPSTTPSPTLDDEEEKRRAGRSGGGDMGNPAHAQLGANMRPEVGSGPAGLETYTTQKSADHNAATPEEMAISDYFRNRFAEAERSASSAPMLTLEAIAADPENALTLRLPPDADKPLLSAARDEVMKQADYLFNWTGEHQDEDPAIRESTREVVDRLSELDARLDALDHIEGRDVEAEAHLQTVNDASTKRQDAERIERSGESAPGEVEASISDYFRNRTTEAEAKGRESDGEELAVLDHGDGQTPGGGGRALF